MPFSFVGRSAVATALLSLALPAAALALCCNQPDPVMNANQICRRDLTKCDITQEQTIDVPSASCQVEGCELDFGARPVTFSQAVTIAAGKLTVRSTNAITIAAPIESAPQSRNVSLDLFTHGADCTAGAGDIVVRSRIDISAGQPGTIRLVAACRVVVEGTGDLATNASGTVDGLAYNGGTVVMLAGTAIAQSGAVRATATGSFGGEVQMTAGDDVAVQRTIDVRSLGAGEGGSITLRAGDPTLAGLAAGGNLSIAADLLADGSADDATSGNDGGSIMLDAAGAITLSGTAMIRANGSSPDGAGGSVVIGTQQAPAGVLTALDGDVTLVGPIVLRGATIGDGGDLDVTAGRDFWLQGAVDVTGGGDDSSAGVIGVTSGRDLRLDAPIAANGRVATSGGGSIEMTAGLASAIATLTAGKPIDVSAGSDSDAGDLRLAACRLTVQPNVLLDARSTLASRTAVITLVSPELLSVGAGSRFLAPSGPSNRILRAPATSVTIGSGVVFNPPVTTSVIPPDDKAMPPCPVCGDGIRQQGEPCDPDASADGACCSSDCLELLCPTPTPSPTATELATGPTLTPTATRTPTATLTPTPTVTVTPGLPPLQPRSVLLCERSLAKGSSRLVTNALTFLESCSLEALACVALGEAERAPCLARATRRCTSRFSKLVRVRRTFAKAFGKACGGEPVGLPFPLLRAPEGLAFAGLEAACADDVGLALTSPSAVLACVEAGSCAGERALATALPRLAELVPQIFDGSSAGFCLVPAMPDPAAPLRTLSSRAALRCQRAVATASRKLLTRELGVAHRCVDALLACRVQGGDAASCAPLADRCARKLGALTDTTAGVRARLASTVVRACSGVPSATLLAADGLGFGRVADTCAGLGMPTPQAAEDLAPCIAAAYGCAAGALVRRALPLVDTELARVGLTLGDDFACPGPSPSPTPTPRPGETSTATRTVVPTPSVTPTPVTPTTLLIMGGGSAVTDCVTEWTVRGAAVDPPSPTTFSCTDGDPSCDADGVTNDVCVFSLGICLAGTDPRLPDCPAAYGVSSFTLQGPQPSSSNPTDAANALALLDVLSDLVGTAPGGAGGNTFTFAPPLVLIPPNHCTAAAAFAVERRDLDLRTERLRARALAGTASGVTDAEDRDILYLTCAAPGS